MRKLTESQRVAITVALEMALQAQCEYLEDGDPSIDYGAEWPRVRSLKNAQFLAMGDVADKILRNDMLCARLDSVAARISLR